MKLSEYSSDELIEELKHREVIKHIAIDTFWGTYNYTIIDYSSKEEHET